VGEGSDRRVKRNEPMRRIPRQCAQIEPVLDFVGRLAAATLGSGGLVWRS